jgi:hypothetical protein
MKYGERADERFMQPFMINPAQGWIETNVIPVCKGCFDKPLEAHSVRGSGRLAGPSPLTPSGFDLPALRAEIMAVCCDYEETYENQYIIRSTPRWSIEHNKALQSLVNDGYLVPLTPNGVIYRKAKDL